MRPAPRIAHQATPTSSRRPAPPTRRRGAPPLGARRDGPHRHCACGGSCPRCASADGAVGRRDDPLEREAAALADRVAGPGAGPAPGARPPGARPAAGSAGRPLDAATRAFMEDRLGEDLGAVRIHDGRAAAQSAAALGARAYTIGRNIAFAGGAYQPGTTAGRHLLAHELGHVLQQRRGAATAIQRMADEDAAGTRPADLECRPDDDEGLPMLLRGDRRNAVGYAQERLNLHLERIIDCLRGPCAIPAANRAFIEDRLLELNEYPLGVDCRFGRNTWLATQIVQAFFLKDPAQWDGKIGPTTWGLLALVRPAPPNIFLPTVPVPPPPGPISL